MTVGEKIQKHRKSLGLSQEELGQQLCVSRQTISLWEKDQTIPTIDNLMRLRDIFGISIDEILDGEEKETVSEAAPKEAYQCTFSKVELKEIFRAQSRRIYKRAILFVLICLVLIVALISSEAPDVLTGAVIGAFFLGTVSHIKGIFTYRKMWKNSTARICESTYTYKFFEDYVEVSIYRNNEKLRATKCYYTDIEQVQQLGKWIFLQFAGQLYVLRKEELKEDSVLYLHVQKKRAKTVYSPAKSGWRVASIVLFAASLASFFVAMLLVAKTSSAKGFLPQNMWMFYLPIPIPIASVVLGFVLKAKGLKYKKNVIVGIIITVALCVYGSLFLIFESVYDHSDEPIVRAEQTVGIEIPAYDQINTQDWTQGSQDASRGYIYYASEVYFDSAVTETFEKKLYTDEKWLSFVSNDLIGIMYPMSAYETYDYALLYNVDTAEYNTLPSESGTFRFINILYDTHYDQMTIAEYDINYVKLSDN